jgi:hypothetical protein
MTFATDFPAEFAWINAEANKGNSFAQNCLFGIRRYGKPTDNMLAAVRRNLVPKPAPTVAPVDASKLFERFEHAFKVGRLKFPKLVFGDFVISRAPDTGRNPGSLYVKNRAEGVYLGMVKNSGFTASRDCTPEVQTTVMGLIADPFAAVDGYGRRTGNCACCGRTLTAAESVDSGIGPICAKKWGF